MWRWQAANYPFDTRSTNLTISFAVFQSWSALYGFWSCLFGDSFCTVFWLIRGCAFLKVRWATISRLCVMPLQVTLLSVTVGYLISKELCSNTFETIWLKSESRKSYLKWSSLAVKFVHWNLLSLSSEFSCTKKRKAVILALQHGEKRTLIQNEFRGTRSNDRQSFLKSKRRKI